MKTRKTAQARHALVMLGVLLFNVTVLAVIGAGVVEVLP